MSSDKESNEVFDFPISINSVEYLNGLRNDLKIDKTMLDDDFCTQHERFAYYATLYELAKDQELRLKKVMEDTYAHVDAEKRFDAMQVRSRDPKFKYTESMCDNECKLDTRYQKAYLEYLNAKKLTGLLGVQKEAFAQRKDMLISLGANMRSSVSDLKLMENAKNIMKGE